MNSIDTQFLQRISRIEQELLVLDSSSLVDFSFRWFTLVDDLQAAIAGGRLEPATVKAAFVFSHRVSKVTSDFLELELLAEESHPVQLPPDESTPSTILPQNTSEIASTRLCNDWLLDNLHNPYPSNCTRSDIAKKSGAQRKDIDNWFIDARKRIGWNAFRRASFNNKRDDIVDAATRFYIKEDPERPLTSAVKREFTMISQRTKDLCYDGLAESALVVGLCSTLQAKDRPRAEPTTQQRLDKNSKAYPSPRHSPKSLGLPISESSPVTPHIPISSTGCKRRSSMSDPESKGHSAYKPMKRAKLDTSFGHPSDIILSTGLPSPAPSATEQLQPPSAEPTVQIPTLPARKRRFSDSIGEPSAKRPRNLPAGPRVQTVSNPISSSSAPLVVDEERKPDFNSSTLLNVEEVDLLTLDIQWGSMPELDFQSTTDSDGGSPEVTPEAFELPQTEFTSLFLKEPNSISQRLDSLAIEDWNLQSLLFNNSGINVVDHPSNISNPVEPSFKLDFSNELDSMFLESPITGFETPASSVDLVWDLLDFPGKSFPNSVFIPAQPLDCIQPTPESCLVSFPNSTFPS